MYKHIIIKVIDVAYYFNKNILIHYYKILK